MWMSCFSSGHMDHRNCRGSLTIWIAFTGTSSSPWGQKDSHRHFLDMTIGDQMAPWAIRSTKNLPWIISPSFEQRSHSCKLGAQGQGSVWQGKPPRWAWIPSYNFQEKQVQFEADMICPQPNSENFQAQTYAHLSCSPAICPDDIQPP